MFRSTIALPWLQADRSTRQLRAAFGACALVSAALLLFAVLSFPRMPVEPLEVIPVLLIASAFSEWWACLVVLGLALAALALDAVHVSGGFGHLTPLDAAAFVAASWSAVLVLHHAKRLAENEAIAGYRSAEGKLVRSTLFQAALPQNGTWRFAAFNPPARGNGASYYHVRTEDRHTSVFVADVPGDGLPASMLLTALKVLCDAPGRDLNDTRGLLGRFNEALRALSPKGARCAAWLGTFDGSGSVRYSSAGYEPALMRTEDGTLRQLEGGGLPLGAHADNRATQSATRLASGDAILLYSGGMADVLDRSGLAVEDLFEHFERVGKRVPQLDHRDDTLALLATCNGPAGSGDRNTALVGLPEATYEHSEG